LLISNGENVKVTQSQLRHTTPKITLELYAQAVSTDPAASSQEGRTDGVSTRISGEIESKKHYRNRVRTVHSLVLGVRGCPKQTLSKSANCFEILVSAAGFEPATHALKGRCSTT
jgi:hypothetical protein